MTIHWFKHRFDWLKKTWLEIKANVSLFKYMYNLHLAVVLSFVNGVSIDCPNMINLAISMKINTIQPSILLGLQSDCCTATGVTCVNQRVTQIAWATSGTSYTDSSSGGINGSAIPSTVQVLNLNGNNEFRKNFPLLPAGLLIFDCYDCSFTNAMPNPFPFGLIRFNCWNCNNIGTIPDPLPAGLVTLDLWHTYTTGSIPATLPSTLEYLDVTRAFISGNLPRILPPGLSYFAVADNSISGPVPTVWPLCMTFVDVSGQSVTGPVPSTSTTCLIYMIIATTSLLKGTSKLFSAGILSESLDFSTFQDTELILSSIFTGIGAAVTISFTPLFWVTVVVKNFVCSFLLVKIFSKTPFIREFKKCGNITIKKIPAQLDGT